MVVGLPTSVLVILLGLMFVLIIRIPLIDNEKVRSIIIGLSFTSVGIIIPLLLYLISRTHTLKELFSYYNIILIIPLIFLLIGLFIIFGSLCPNITEKIIKRIKGNYNHVLTNQAIVFVNKIQKFYIIFKIILAIVIRNIFMLNTNIF